ncbi:MAG: DUF4249 domain-containing protein [Tangfeifania sp.]
MKKNTLFILLIIPGVFLFPSCEKDVTFDFDHNPKLVLNCILNPDSVVSASLTLSESLDSTANFKPVRGAEIIIYEGNNIFGVLEPTGNGRYKLDKKPEPGKTYKIEVKGKNHDPLLATTTVPKPPVIEYSKTITDYITPDSTIYTFDVNIKLNDNPGRNSYWIYQKYIVGGVQYSRPANAVNAPFLDEFNKIIDPDSNYGYRLPLGMRLTDEGFDGQMLGFVIPDFVSIEERELSLFFLDADEHYDKHIKTIILNRMKENSELPFFEPVQIYSNIENGYGIFGSCAITTIDF